MIPVTLTVKGLYSYQAEQTVHFDRLTQAHVFGIFGKTGSGKSSILEAITLALYGEVDRLNNKDNRGYNMMNQRSNELLVDFTFRHTDGKLYRFVVKGKRNGKRFDVVPTFKRTAYVMNDSWETLPHTDGEELLGMSYKNFRRTVIIPQGKFQEFMELSDKDRTVMLKEIFHLDKFEFYNQAAALEKHASEAARTLEGNLMRYDGVSEEVIAEKQTAVIQQTLQLNAQRKTLTEKENEVAALQRLRQLFDELETKRGALRALQTLELSYKQRQQKLDGYEYCYKHFRHNFILRNDLLQKIPAVEKRLKAVEQARDTNASKLATCNESYAQAEKDFGMLDWWKDELHDCGQLLKLLTLQAESNELNRRIAGGNKALAQQEEKVNALRNEVQRLEAQWNAASQQLPALDRLNDAKLWFAKKEALEKEINELQTNIKSTDEANKLTEHAFITKLLNRFRDETSFEKNPSLANAEQSLLAYRQRCNDQLEQLRIQLADCQHLQKLEAYAQALEDGVPCPLCGSEHHPDVLRIDDVQQRLNEIHAATNAQQSRLAQCDGALKELNRSQATIHERLAQHNALINTLTDKQTQLQQHTAQFSWDGFSPDNRRQVEQAYDAANEQHKRARVISLQLSERRNEQDQAHKEFDKFKKAVEHFIQQLTGNQSKQDVHRQQLKRLTLEDMPDNESLRMREADLKKSIAETVLRYNGLTDERNALQTEQRVLDERLTATQQELAQHQQTLEHIEADIADCLCKSSYKTRDEVEAILAQTMDTEDERNQLQSFNGKLFAAREGVTNLETQLDGKRYDAATAQALSNETDALRITVQQLNDELVKENALLQQLQTDWIEKQKLVAQLDALEQRAANLNTLLKLFKGSGFVNYISSKYLNNLCAAANERFHKLVGNKYTLSITDTNDFQICDHFNANKLRDVKTLSGGQKFQAALSLALALAGEVQEQNKSQQNFFFLDEGFGSLDKESLQLVFDTLKTLRKENRVVGVISHVEELQQEIDAYLHITNERESGSRIEYSWEVR